MELIAASKIQHYFRQNNRNRQLNDTVNKRAEYILKAIRRVQARFMCRLVRKRYLHLIEVTKNIQKWVRMIIWKRYYEKTLKWVCALQQIFRKKHAIRAVKLIHLVLMKSLIKVKRNHVKNNDRNLEFIYLFVFKWFKLKYILNYYIYL